MIDLRNKALPDAITVDGRAYKIYTDYRVWLNFGEVIKKPDCTPRDLLFVFVNEFPVCDFVDELIQFYTNPNATPVSLGDSGSGEQLYDYILDGEYIYASFLKEYGIDLVDTDMHWHKFKALFISLSEDSKIKEIMGYRGYTESGDKDAKNMYRRLKAVWSFDNVLTQEDIEAIEAFDKLFE